MGIGIVVVLVILVVVGAVFVYPMISGGGLSLPSGSGDASPTPTSSSSTGTSPLTADKVVVKETTAPVIPATGIYVHVNYIGGFSGKYGMPDSLTNVPGNSGDRIWEVENANGTVIAEFEKLDGSSHEILVEIYKNGALLTKDSSTTGHGSVKLSVDASTGVAASPVSSAGSATAAAVTAATNESTVSTTATTTTASVTTKATSAPATNTTTAAP